MKPGLPPDPYGTGDLFDVSPFIDHGHHEPVARVKSVAQGNCPGCSRAKVGLVFGGGGHLLWRMHTYKTHGGASLPCRAVGLRVCVLPESRPYLNASEPVHCAHA